MPRWELRAVEQNGNREPLPARRNGVVEVRRRQAFDPELLQVQADGGHSMAIGVGLDGCQDLDRPCRRACAEGRRYGLWRQESISPQTGRTSRWLTP